MTTPLSTPTRTLVPGLTPVADAPPAPFADAAFVATELERARARTLAIVDALSPADQRAQHSPLMSPMVWDLAHIGNYEELWLLRAIDGRAAIDPALDDLYNAFEHPRWARPSLPILGPDEARAYGAEVRAGVLDLLGRVDLTDATNRLLRDGFVYGMVVQHEHQHDETLLATLQLMSARAVPPPASTVAPRRPLVDPASLPAERAIDGGITRVGTADHPWAYDNERIDHLVEVPPFRIDTFPVTVGAYAAFVAAGGYDDEGLWHPDGWAWRHEAGLTAPQFWQPDGCVTRFGSPIDRLEIADEPVQHVCWYEADAFARWAGRRLPTEIEWERAAEGAAHPGFGTAAAFDATRNQLVANLGAVHDGPSVVGAHPLGASRWGVHQMLGDVWEWTSSTFGPWPGFEAFPYAEYSEVFWGDAHRVLKGGSWAADPVAVRRSFRNWDLPIRRQIFSGFRTAADA